MKTLGGFFALLLGAAACTSGGEGAFEGAEGGAGPGGFGGASAGDDEITPDPELLQVAGSYCSLRVNRPENCVGADAHYFSFEADLSEESPTALSGQYCREYGVDCARLKGAFEEGTLSYTYETEVGSFSSELSYDVELESLTGLGYSVHCDCFVDFYLFSIDD